VSWSQFDPGKTSTPNFMFLGYQLGLRLYAGAHPAA
jgi:hypothetical protein